MMLRLMFISLFAAELDAFAMMTHAITSFTPPLRR